MRVICDYIIILLFLQFYALSSDYFGNRLREYELNLRLVLNLTRGYDKTAWPFFVQPTEANAFYTGTGFNFIGEHNNIISP